MNAIRPVAVKLDQDTRDRLRRLADAKDRFPSLPCRMVFAAPISISNCSQ